MSAPQAQYRSFAVGLILVLLLQPGSVRAGVPQVNLPAHPHRVIVKYRSTVTACAHCLLAHGTAFATVTGTDSLDRLNRRFHVRRATGLFVEDHASFSRSAAYQKSVDAGRARFSARAARAPKNAAAPDLSNVFVIDLDAGVDPQAAAKAFAADPDVEFAEPDYRMRTTLTPNDPYFSTSGSWGNSFPDLWGLHTTHADTAWDTSNGNGIVVAVIDTGVSYTHPDLKNNVWKNAGEIPGNHKDDDGNGYVDDVYGWDFIKHNGRPKDRHGHGTHVAGTIAATGNNGIGVIGMAYGARVMAVRGLDAKGSGWTSDLAKGIVYAAQNGADVLNNSWGGGGYSLTLEAAVQTATSLGAVTVFAAGNNNSSALGPAAIPQTIAVAATSSGDVRASFSNYGASISVAAPGVDILSLKGPGRVGGQTVGRKYRVLSGTSMAAPHTAGVAALLLAKTPGLTADEVRWHLELNADQPGYPGYEGQPWNPYFGWGRINAARVFDPPPVTTRISTAPIELHSLPDTVAPNAATLDLRFTTLAPVDWSAAGPAWLAPATSSGTGATSLPLTLDSTGLSPATYSGTVTVSAPAAVDGGGGVAGILHVHRDNRGGGEIVINDNFRNYGGPPRVVSDGHGVFTAWVEQPLSGGPSLSAAYVDELGTVTGPFVIDAGGCIEAFCYVKDGNDVAVGFDGTNFVVTWVEWIDGFVSDFSLRKRRTEFVKAARVTPSGQVLDNPPLIVASKTENADIHNSYDKYFYGVGVGFDGTGYTVLWGQLDFGATTYAQAVKAFIRRVGANGALPAPVRQIYPIATTQFPQYIEPKIACVTGSCLIAWHEADGELSPLNAYIDKLYGQRFAGDVAVDAKPVRLVTDIEDCAAIASNGTGYFVAGFRFNVCPGPRICGFDVVGARVTANGVSLDPSGIILNNDGVNGSAHFIDANAIAFDGTNYIVTWGDYSASPNAPGYYAFAARVGLDGSVLDSEPEGLLLEPGPTVSYWPMIASTAKQSLLVWDEPGSYPSRIVAQGMFSH